VKKIFKLFLPLFLCIGFLASCYSTQSNSSTSDTTMLNASIDTSITRTGSVEKQLPEASNQETGTILHNATDSLISFLLNTKDLKVSKELITLFFYYYREHSLELRLLPSFDEGETPDWDDLTHFVFAMADHERSFKNELFVSEKAFDETVKKYFTDVKYTHDNSSYVNYTGEGYTATGWDDHGSVYYCLKSITKADDGTYTASFDGIKLEETDYWSDYDSASPTMKAIMDKTNTEMSPENVGEFILNLFTLADYSVFCKRKFLTFAKFFPQAPMWNFYVNPSSFIC